MPLRGDNRKTTNLAHEVIIVYVIFGLIYVALVLPYLTTASWFFTLNPIAAYLLYNFGYIFILAGTFGFIVGLAGGDADIDGLLKSGIAGFLLFSWIFDMWQPPLAWSLSGQLLIPAGTAALENVAVDYIWGWIFLGLGVPPSILFYIVYGVVPILAIIFAGLLISPSKFLT